MKEALHFDRRRHGRLWWHEPHGRMHFWHHHVEVEFNLVVRGTARYLVKDRSYALSRGDLIFLFPDQEHLLVDLSADFACWIAVARPGPLRRLRPGAGDRDLHQGDPDLGNCRRIDDERLRRLDALYRESLLATDTPAANVLHGAVMVATWQAFLVADRRPAPILHPAVERSLGLLAADPEAGLETVATKAGLSLSRLSRLFHAQVGESLVAHRQRQRLERFRRLRQQHPQRTLLALALDAGFGSYAQFHRAVRRFTGVSPQDWDDAAGFVPRDPAAAD